MNDGDNVNDDDDRDDIISCKINSAGSQKPILLGCEIS